MNKQDLEMGDYSSRTPTAVKAWRPLDGKPSLRDEVIAVSNGCNAMKFFGLNSLAYFLGVHV